MHVGSTRSRSLLRCDHVHQEISTCVVGVLSSGPCPAGKGEGVSITAYAAGRLLGGSMWRISRQGEDHVYAVGLNHRKERLVAIGRGGTPEDLFTRPALYITGTSLRMNPIGRAQPALAVFRAFAQVVP